MNKLVVAATAAIALVGCGEAPTPADLVVTDAVIYTQSDSRDVVEAMAIRDGEIVWIGLSENVTEYIGEATRVLDLSGAPVYPGLIEGHGHLSGLGSALVTLDLSSAATWSELLSIVEGAKQTTEPGEWIVGWGWHQSKWSDDFEMVAGFPVHHQLSEITPDNPVYLAHASGHAALVNQRAMTLAGITNATEVDGDGIVVKFASGEPTGALNETAAQLVEPLAYPATVESALANIVRAGEFAITQGITSFHDAGASMAELEAAERLASEGQLPVRVYAMISGSSEEMVSHWFSREPLIDGYDRFLTVRSIKAYGDGALGSRGAWLLEPYTDAPDVTGMPIMPMIDIHELAQRALASGYQLNVHAIGDRANREVLDRFEQALIESNASNHRFRIEHAQHLHPDDIERFAELGVIPSMQTIHMSSDRPWAIDRLGEQRIVEGAYVWADLLSSGAVIVNGTDVPVEPINPIANFFAAVTRQTLLGTPDGGYEPAQKMTRQQALDSMTRAPAYGAFEEHFKGQLTPGFVADFVILSQDIMTVPDDQILATEVNMTVIEGEIRYER